MTEEKKFETASEYINKNIHRDAGIEEYIDWTEYQGFLEDELKK